MEITLFSKKRTTLEGKIFYSFLSTLTKKDGTQQTVSVKFRDECGHPKPEKCPCNIIVNKEDCNMATKSFTREDTGEPGVSYTMWISKWAEGSVYVDHSMDDFDI